MASCPNHALNAEQHCEEMERMLEHVPDIFCEGEGDMPSEAVKRFKDSYEEQAGELAIVESAVDDALVIIRSIQAERILSPVVSTKLDKVISILTREE